MDVEKFSHPSNTRTNIQGTSAFFFSFNKKIATGGWRAALLILGVELCERLATLGIGLNLVIYLHNHMHLSIPTSANVVTNFFGTSFITCLLGGFVADTYLGRYGTIAAGASIQLIGMIMMILSAALPRLSPPPCHRMECKPANMHQRAILYGALYMIALGTGGVKSCVSGLGADQFDEEQEEGRKMMQSFFNWFGVGVSMASVLAVTVLAYLQDNVAHGIAYVVSATCITFSLFLFLIGFPIFHCKPPNGSPISLISRILLKAWRNRHLESPPMIDIQHNNLGHDALTIPRIPHTNQFLFLDKAALVDTQCKRDSNGKDHIKWNFSCLEEVEEVKMFTRLLPILGTTIVFWTGNAQMITFSTQQASTLDRRLGNGFMIPPASLHLFVQLGSITTLSLYDRLLIPLARRWRANEYGITSLQRIGIGIIFSIISLVVASLVEKKRIQVAHSFSPPNGQGSELPMSVFYLAPQFCIVGIGEAFGYIGQLEFFFRESPTGMRSLGTGLCLSTISLGFFLSSALVDAVNKFSKHGRHQGWLTNDLSTSRLDNFYLFIALCSFISFLAYLVCSYWYVYNDKWGIHKTKVENVSLSGDDDVTN